jgi:hypothetical protein
VIPPPAPNGKKKKHKTGAWERVKRVLTGADSAEQEEREQELDEAMEELQSSVKETRAETEAAKARQARRRPTKGA